MRFGPLAIVILLLPLAALAEIRGGVRVLDGDTISVQGIQIEIDGIDAPEPEQRCLRDSGRSYACGELATRALRTIIGGRRVRCEELGKTVTGTIRARCRLRRRDLGQEMLALGWALAHEGAARDYAEAQARAETAREGIWSGRFVPPWEWRQGKRIVESPAAPAPPATTAARSGAGDRAEVGFSPGARPRVQVGAGLGARGNRDADQRRAEARTTACGTGARRPVGARLAPGIGEA